MHKLLNHEVKKRKETPARKTKQKQSQQQRQQQQRQQQQGHQQHHNTIVKNGQKAHRKAVVNKNRGLPALFVASKNKTAHGKTKTGISAITANLRRHLQADKSIRSSPNRQVVGKTSIKRTASPFSLKKKNARRQERKVTSYAYAKQPKSGQKLQVQKARLKAKTERPIRQVVRISNDKSRLSITVAGRKKVVTKKTRAREAL